MIALPTLGIATWLDNGFEQAFRGVLTCSACSPSSPAIAATARCARCGCCCPGLRRCGRESPMNRCTTTWRVHAVAWITGRRHPGRSGASGQPAVRPRPRARRHLRALAAVALVLQLRLPRRDPLLHDSIQDKHDGQRATTKDRQGQTTTPATAMRDRRPPPRPAGTPPRRLVKE